MSFITPMAYNTNLLIMGAGGYRFSDFVRIGTPLAVIMWLALSFLLPWLLPALDIMAVDKRRLRPRSCVARLLEMRTCYRICCASQIAARRG
jgi:Na+/H+ antiporter NhaD/arsenite permease-like protein